MAATPTLEQLADREIDVTGDEQLDCLANAIYFEARSEPLEGQLAVADVVLNRTASHRYPDSWCEVIKQKAQFSFVVNGRFPKADKSSLAWKRAKAIAKVAADRQIVELPEDVLWYHAYYVAPKWRLAMSEVKTIGAHTFYTDQA